MSTRLITTYLAQQRQDNARRAREANANGTNTVVFTHRHAQDVMLNANLETSVLTMQEDMRPENTQKAMDPKAKEYFAFCDLVYPNDPFKFTLDYMKVYKFMYYQSFREQKQRGGKKQQGGNELFDLELFHELMAQFASYDPDSPEALGNYPRPTRPIGKATFDQYKAVFRRLYKVQRAKNVLSLHWDSIWMMGLDEMAKHVKTRAPKIKRQSYQEKVDGEFAPYLIVEQYPMIEEALWNDSKVVSRRMIAARLRHRYSAQHLTAGILRCESLSKAEWSDFLGIIIPKKITDIDDMFCMINQIPLGKTNHGRTLYGRAVRHKDVRLCCIGGLSFYTQYRFFCTGEFEDFNTDDWVQRDKWFDVKVLVDVQAPDYKKELSKDTYGKHIGTILSRLKISCSKLCHLGRNLGARILEMLEEESEEIRRMGQWNPSIFDNSYSAKLPLGPMRKLAGFHSSNKMYYNPRTTCIPEEELLRATPMGAWCYEALEGVLEVSNDGENQTAIHTLKFFCELNKVFLQDAASMLILHPERADHPIFHELSVFGTKEFETYKNKMEITLQSSSDPIDASLETVLPGVHQRMQATQDALMANTAAVHAIDDRIDTLCDRIDLGLTNVVQHLDNERARSDRKIASAFLQVTTELLRDTSGRGHLGKETPAPSTPTNDTGTSTGTGTTVTDGTSPDVDMLLNTNSPPSGNRSLFSSPGEPKYSNYRMAKKHKTLEDMWDEWNGTGRFADDDGGIKGRNKKYGAKWRKHLEVQQYSRTKCIIQAVLNYADNHRVEVGEALSVMNKWYVEAPVSASLTKMKQLCVDKELLKKGKVRGKQCKRQQQQQQNLEVESEEAV